MTAFYVGQRVRVTYSRNHPRYVGREGFIVEMGTYIDRHVLLRTGRIEDFFGYVMDFDQDFAPKAYQLEPILPDGLESLEDINALYETNPCEADV